ncbi:MAG: alpha-glucan family phosphorylase [Anaerolineales bacterium]|nr:alpha-glucan family phosphorylase [Anaerolineales bacterium]MDW8160737.1 alpha-glucan family phosphorylase [Anaerolineales bacterium]
MNEVFQAHYHNRFPLPRRIERLGELAYNLWWTWNPEAVRLYMRIDPLLWERTYHNPIKFLRQVERAKINAATLNRYYLENYDRVLSEFDSYMQRKDTWFAQTYPQWVYRPIAYFSMEFGLHETLPIYAGGLGVLSGDHLKEASDLGLPMVAVGFFYTEGYFTQRITEDGWQEAEYTHQVFDDLPVLPVLDEEEKPITVSVELPGREVQVRLWEVHVGRIPLYLLDANVEANSVTDRTLTARLYSGDLEMRIAQELLLGIGGVRALRVLGYNPSVWHMNEGHSAFLVLERLREYIEAGKSFEEAKEIVKASNVFTTHTPVPAGNDEFPLWLIEKYLAPIWTQLGITREEFIELGRHTTPWGEMFSMPVLGLKLSEGRNAVSELHGQVARKMWHFLWPDLEVDEVPITHITNGVHLSTWLARRMRYLFDEYLGEDWIERHDDFELWEKVMEIPDEKLWEVHRHLKRKLAYYIRERARWMWARGNVHPVQVIASGVLLDPYALTIGFARRFAPYKRANLLLHDPDRLLRIVTRADMPVQIIFAGKSHPDHEGGKLIIQEIYRFLKRSEVAGRMVFLEEYDVNLARYLVQGVDVWLNTPRRPNEASGTSGMKAALNGVLNCSVYDGWWREGYNGQNGWAIGQDVDYDDPQRQDEEDARSLYDLLEQEIVPLYYRRRSSDELPGDWLYMMKDAMRTIVPQFVMRRMVKEYLDRLYIPILSPKKKVIET